MTNPVKKKIVYLIEAELASPLCVSNGDGELTDQDVIKNAEGKPFVPGSSLAGAMRGYLQKASDEACIFGYEISEEKLRKSGEVLENGKMSSVFVSDLTFAEDPRIKVRDGVALSSGKTAITGAQFDMEVIDTGAKGYFYVEMVIRAEDAEDEMKQQLFDVFAGWKIEDIRLGAKKTRGYGKLKLISVKEKVFDKNNILTYANVYQYEEKNEIFKEESILKKISLPQNPRYITLIQPLKLNGGISIRQYSVKKGEPDFVHVTAGENDDPVIPGTSMAGAVRHRLEDILNELEIKNVQEILRMLFGIVKDEKACRSSVTFDECVLSAKELTMVRNGISRFESATKKGALFQEKSYVGGTTTLKIRVENNLQALAKIGLLLLVLKDLTNGYLAVGGQTAVGRGIFESAGELQIIGTDHTEEEYFKEAYRLLQRKGEKDA